VRASLIDDHGGPQVAFRRIVLREPKIKQIFFKYFADDLHVRKVEDDDPSCQLILYLVQRIRVFRFISFEFLSLVEKAFNALGPARTLSNLDTAPVAIDKPSYPRIRTTFRPVIIYCGNTEAVPLATDRAVHLRLQTFSWPVAG
jgi:hypothetical protein